jgi:hypothetical protein
VCRPDLLPPLGILDVRDFSRDEGCLTLLLMEANESINPLYCLVLVS